jgi:LAGLIDADG endonuclease
VRAIFFFVLISKSKLDNTVSQVQVRFRIPQHSRDQKLIESLVNYFGCGRIEVRLNQNLVEYVVTKFSDISNIILPPQDDFFFTQYFLRGSKLPDYSDFVKVVNLTKDKSHLTDLVAKRCLLRF